MANKVLLKAEKEEQIIVKTQIKKKIEGFQNELNKQKENKDVIYQMRFKPKSDTTIKVTRGSNMNEYLKVKDGDEGPHVENIRLTKLFEGDTIEDDFVKNFNLPINKKQLKNLDYLKFDKDSKEYKYLISHRKELGGFLPKRSPSLEKLELDNFNHFDEYWTYVC